MLLLCIIISTPVTLLNHKESYHQYMKHMGKQLNLRSTFQDETSIRFNSESLALREISQTHFRSNNRASSRQGMTAFAYNTTLSEIPWHTENLSVLARSVSQESLVYSWNFLSLEWLRTVFEILKSTRAF